MKHNCKICPGKDKCIPTKFCLSLSYKKKYAALDIHLFGSGGVVLDTMALFNAAQSVLKCHPDHLINLHTPGIRMNEDMTLQPLALQT